MRSSFAGPCLRPCLSNSYPPGATLPAGFLFALVWVLPCWGVLLPCCRHPFIFSCRLRGGSVLPFLFPGVISPGFFFRPAPVLLRCAPSPPRLRGRMAFPVALCGPFPWRWGLHIRPPVLPSGGFWGRRGGGPGPCMAGCGPGVSCVGRPIFFDGLP